MRKRSLRHPQRAEQVGFDLSAGLLLGGLLDHSEVAVARVVHDDVELAEMIPRLADRRENSSPVGHVERQRLEGLRVLRRQVVGRVRVAGGAHDPVAAGECGGGPLTAETARCASDEPRSWCHGGTPYLSALLGGRYLAWARWATTASADGSAEAGFWPVMRLPSTTTVGAKAGPPSKSAPFSRRRVSSSHFALSPKPNWVSSSSVKPVIFWPAKGHEPSAFRAGSSAPTPWQSAATALLLSGYMAAKIRPITGLSARSSIGPWPPET